MTNATPSALSLTYTEYEIPLPWGVVISETGEKIAAFRTQHEAERFVYSLPLYVNGPQALPPKLRAELDQLTKIKP